MPCRKALLPCLGGPCERVCWFAGGYLSSFGAFPAIKTDLVALLDEWATRFFEELDYIKEGQNGMEFAESMCEDLPQVRALSRLHCQAEQGVHMSASSPVTSPSDLLLMLKDMFSVFHHRPLSDARVIYKPDYSIGSARVKGWEADAV